MFFFEHREEELKRVIQIRLRLRNGMAESVNCYLMNQQAQGSKYHIFILKERGAKVFWLKKRKKNINKKDNENQLQTKQHITFFGQEYDININVDMEASEAENIPDASFAILVDRFLNNIPRIQDQIEKYVRREYRSIIYFYYLGLVFESHKGKEYQEHLLILKDYEDKTTNAMDIVLRNIKPKHFSIIDEKKGYFYSYINNSLAYGIDAIISMSSSDIIIKMDDGDFD